MDWIFNGKLQNTLSIPFVATGSPQVFSVRLTTADGETLPKAYLCMLAPDFIGQVWGRISGTTRWFRVGGIWDSECFLGTIPNWSFVDIDVKIDLDGDTVSGSYRLPFVCMFGDSAHGPNRNWCSESDTTWASVGGAMVGSDHSLWGDDEFENPLWTGSEGRCPPYDTGSNCGVPVYGAAVPSGSISQFQTVTTFVQNGITKMRKATLDSLQHATTVGMLIDDAISMVKVSGAATVQSPDGRYIYEQGGQEVNDDGTLSQTWHPEVRVFDTQTGVWRNIGTCGEAQQRDHTLAVLNGVLYIMGGGNGKGLYYKSLYAFDLTTLQCTQLADAPVTRAGGSVIINGPELQFIAGWNESGAVTEVDIYETETQTWTAIPLPPDIPAPPPPGPTLPGPTPPGPTPPGPTPPGPFPPDQFVGFPTVWTAIADPFTRDWMVCVDGQIYTGNAAGSQIDVFSLNGSLLRTLTPSAIPWPSWQDYHSELAQLRAAYRNGKIYLGNPFYQDALTSPTPVPMAIYDIASNTWSTVTSNYPPALPDIITGGEEPGYWTQCGVGIIGTKVYFWGGRSCPDPVTNNPTEIFVFDTSNNTWDQSRHTVGSEYASFAGAICNGKLYQQIPPVWAEVLHLYGSLQITNLSDFSVTIDSDPSHTLEINTGIDWSGAVVVGPVIAFTIGTTIYWIATVYYTGASVSDPGRFMGFEMWKQDPTTHVLSTLPSGSPPWQFDSGGFWTPATDVSCSGFYYVRCPWFTSTWETRNTFYIFSPASAGGAAIWSNKRAIMVKGADGRYYTVDPTTGTIPSNYFWNPKSHTWGSGGGGSIPGKSPPYTMMPGGTPIYVKGHVLL